MLAVLLPADQVFGRLKVKSISFNFMIAATLAILSYFLRDTGILIAILIKILIQRIKYKVPLISDQSIALLAIAIVVFPVGNMIIKSVSLLKILLSEQSPLLNWLAPIILSILVVISMWIIYHYAIRINELIHFLNQDRKILQAITTFLTALFLLELGISLVAVQLNLEGIFQSLIIFSFTVFIIATFVMMWYFVASYRRSIDAKTKLKDFQQQQDYLKKVEENYEALRQARHDYQNQLLSVQSYLQGSHSKDGEAYVQQLLNETNASTHLDQRIFADLSKIQVPSIRGLLFAKLKQMVQAKIQVTFEVEQPITATPQAIVDVVRIIGILIDNAIEAVQAQKNGALHLALVSYTPTTYEFIIENTVTDPELDIDHLFERGYSSKAAHSGLGLATVQQLTAVSDELLFEVSKHDRYVRFSLLITTAEKGATHA
ncbi:GHKL domain-containing protein [Lactobacillus sp. CC-MHH1034]|uniref:sensor histidine kinase n=1 Tax=Agrilactobacillus fermenti TaxID=2586909 RepID=UPI001E37B6AA|nr:GHKL domain-containing protein [Agrilactobacillus fermenti]MCD2255759.1 GHKL domain-containing protein [Agrilactobacillus fermenti]